MSAWEKLVVVIVGLLYCVLSIALPLWAGLKLSLWFFVAWIVLLPQCVLLLRFVLALMKDR